jgi:hypothetical protein
MRQLGLVSISTDSKGATMLKYIPPKNRVSRGTFDLALTQEEDLKNEY